MAAPSIVAEGVSKRFSLHQARIGSFRELLTRRRAGEKRPEKEFWALQDIDFAVEPGHPLAIIGHNGSGKSTLLKLLTGILKPTRGSITVNGRIGALIEVGAGFHPDLTGRENVYLNGAILGATRREIGARFDQIVAFAGLESFIDTPVKRYSSGMYMRLGFSIAAHLDPEILLIDEVLAVGDAQFQSRCLRFLHDFVGRGGSVVFVSHAMGHVRELCDRCLWLDHGQVMGFGESDPIIARYEALVEEREDAEFARLFPAEWAAREQEKRRQAERAERLTALLAERDRRRAARAEARAQREAQERAARLAREEAARHQQEQAAAFFASELGRLREEETRRHALWSAELLAREAARAEAEARARAEARRVWEASPERFKIVASELCDAEKKPTRSLRVGERALLQVRYRAGRALQTPVIGVDFLRLPDQLHLFTVSNYDHQKALPTPGEGLVSLWVDGVALGQGRYRVRLATYADCERPEWFHQPEHVVEDALEFEVDAGRFANGCAYLKTDWETKMLKTEGNA